jgi:hypothetical protein
MKFLVALLAAPSILFADAGVEFSYRPIPAYVSYLPSFPDGNQRTGFETIETGMISFYLGDTLKGHSKTKGGYYATKFYVRVYEDPSEKYPVGRMVEQEVDIGDAQTAEEINMRNAWKKESDRVSKVYAKQVWIDSEVKGVLPGWTNPNRGAGYTLSLNIVFGSITKTVDIYGVDLLIGKRIFIIPHLFHVYGKVGPSIMAESWQLRNDRWVNSNLGAVVSGGMQVQVLKGIKFFTEVEFRGYGPALAYETDASITLLNKLPFMEREVRDHYSDYQRNDGMTSYRELMKESLRFGIKFTF